MRRRKNETNEEFESRVLETVKQQKEELDEVKQMEGSKLQQAVRHWEEENAVKQMAIIETETEVSPTKKEML
jgi:hypothetical protein